MTASNAKLDLALNRLGLRFNSPETERIYRRWRNEQNLPVVRLTTLVPIPPWLAAPWSGYLWWPGPNWFDIWLIGYLFVVPALALTTLATYTRLRRQATLLAALSLTITGSSMLWVVVINLRGIPDFETTGMAVAFVSLMASFGLFMRLPPMMAAMSILPFTAAAIGIVVHRTYFGTLPTIYAYPYIWVPAVMYFFVTLMSALGERFIRRAFISEQIVTEQNISLENSRNLIRRYVPSALVEHIIKGKLDAVETPQRRRVTILFADIVGFTDIADRIEPEVMTEIIGEYMATMADIVDAHKGTVNEFVGDGLMAIFGAPQSLSPEQQARAAVVAAQAMQAKLPELNARWRKLGLGEHLKIRIGINTGMASVGSYGSEGRMTYTAIGLQTNIAARIQSHCEPGGILLSDATWQLVRDDIECMSKGQVECKGVHFPVAVYSPSRQSSA